MAVALDSVELLLGRTNLLASKNVGAAQQYLVCIFHVLGK